jgi:hypothetical protein
MVTSRTSNEDGGDPRLRAEDDVELIGFLPEKVVRETADCPEQ